MHIEWTPPSESEVKRVRDHIEWNKARENAKPLPAGMRRAIAVLHGPHSAMTEDELAEFAAQKAREMRRAEMRRNPSLRPDLFGS